MLMKKEEILEMSRKENKNKEDVYKRQLYRLPCKLPPDSWGCHSSNQPGEGDGIDCDPKRKSRPRRLGCQILCLYLSLIHILNLVSVWIDNLYFYYIEDLDYAKGLDAMIQVSVYQTDDYYEQNEFSAALDKSAASIVEYYYSFGLQGGEFDYYAVYNDLDVWQLLVELHTDIKAEY